MFSLTVTCSCYKEMYYGTSESVWIQTWAEFFAHVCVCFLTRPEVHSGIDTLQSSTLQIPDSGSICAEQNHVVPQVRAEEFHQVTQVIKITRKVTAILVLHLIHTKTHFRPRTPDLLTDHRERDETFHFLYVFRYE